MEEHNYYIYVSDAEFSFYSHFNQAFIAHWFVNSSKNIDVVNLFLLLIAVSNLASLVFHYVAKLILF